MKSVCVNGNMLGAELSWTCMRSNRRNGLIDYNLSLDYHIVIHQVAFTEIMKLVETLE